jgi:hypothetical protein
VQYAAACCMETGVVGGGGYMNVYFYMYMMQAQRCATCSMLMIKTGVVREYFYFYTEWPQGTMHACMHTHAYIPNVQSD